MNKTKHTTKNVIFALKVVITCLMLSLILMSNMINIAFAVPEGPRVTYNQTYTATPRPGTFINTSGGTFTTLNLNVTQQDPRWKAYAGNITGKLLLSDAQNLSIYDWTWSETSGEVYATRANSINWPAIICANAAKITAEEVAMNHTATNADSISLTFNRKVHKKFYVGTKYIANSTCFSIATYINGKNQTVSENAKFQEVLLTDTTNLLYVTLLENAQSGFNNKKYDFQLLVAESDKRVNPTPYYFYVELV